MTAPATGGQPPPARQVQQRALAVLTGLLAADLPTVLWHVDPSDDDVRTARPATFPILDGQADAHSTVRAWAAHLGTEVALDHGTTPSTRAVIDGIGLRVWCAPEYRDGASANASGSEGR